MSHIRYTGLPGLSDEEILGRAHRFNEQMQQRRTVRSFSDRPVAREVIEQCLRVAGSAPSGANLQPWSFVAISDPAVKRKIRLAAEDEERAFYSGRAPQPWLEVLKPLETNESKPFLEVAPWLVAIFVQRTGRSTDGVSAKHYYAIESVGIATGLLITACHLCGLATLTHTPSPMNFLATILERPDNERPFLLLVIGHPAEGATVPDIERKRFDEIAHFVEPST